MMVPSLFFDRKMKMKMLVVFGVLLQVSQNALAAVVEVYEGAESVLMPCVYKGFIPENPLVMWTRNDLNPTSVHLRQVKGDDLTDQNQDYRGRTSMDPNALSSDDFNLTLRKPRLSDSGNYICIISDGVDKVKVTEVQLKVKAEQEKAELMVEKGTDSIILPCTTTPDLPEDTTVEWTRSHPVFMFVHVFPNTSKHSKDKDDQYCGRTKMNQDLLRTGNLSLTMNHLRVQDNGSYICTIYRHQDILRQEVVLTYVEPGFPPWATPLVLLGLMLVILIVGCVYFKVWEYFMPVYQVKVESGVKSVLLPCKTTAVLFKDSKLEWTDRDKKKVHVFENSADQPEEQDKFYRNRTELKKSLLRLGDLSLTLKHPPDRDSETFTCRVYNKVGTILMEKRVLLEVKVQQVEVESGVESVLLSYRTKDQLPEDTKVVWRDEADGLVHVFENGSDQPEEQHWFYRNRTEMNKDLLRTGDLSLTLKHPTYSETFTCKVYNKEGHILMMKQVDLKVNVPQAKAESGVESVLLSCRTTEQLPEYTKVVWTDKADDLVHVFENGSDQPEEQHWFYRNRTEMNKDLLRTGDLSLTLKHPTYSETFTCKVYNKEGHILMMKQVDLKVKVPQQEVESGAESVLLSYRTTDQLPEDSKVEWTDEADDLIHVFENGSDQPEEQHWFYRNRTEMNKDLLRTGDLSLTLKHPTDSLIFTCRVYNKEGHILMMKQVDLKVKVPKVEVESGAESVLLSYRTTNQLPEDTKVVWTDRYTRKVHVFKNSSDQPEEQHWFYRNRTEMNKDLLRTGDLSLTLKHPTDSLIFTCTVYSKEEDILMMKQVYLEIKVPQVEVESGAESVLLSYRTTDQLPNDTIVVWRVRYLKVHVFKNGSDQPEEQHQVYRNRTEMNKDLLKTGDPSLTLKHPTVRDSHVFTCRVYNKGGHILMVKQVDLKVKGSVQVQGLPSPVRVQVQEVIRTRSGSTDPAPLLAVQSV